MPEPTWEDRMRRRNYVQELGSGDPPLLFAHGFGCDQTLWRGVTPAFASEHRVVLFDYVGSGRSDLAAYDRARYSTVNGYAQDILDVCEALDLRDTVVVAHSVGANFAIKAAIDQPQRFKQLILLGPSPYYLNDPPGYRGGFEPRDIDAIFDMMDRNFLDWARYLAPITMGNADRPELSRSLEETFCANDPAIARTFAEVTFLSDCRPLLPQLKVPASIIHIEHDTLVSSEVADYVHAHIPQSTLTVMPASGHLPHVSHPRETIAAIRAALADPPGGRG